MSKDLTNQQQPKKPFDIEEAFVRLRRVVEPFAKATLFELRDEGFTPAFEQLVACIISIRTYDETMIEVARRLFEVARTPVEVFQLSVDKIDSLI